MTFPVARDKKYFMQALGTGWWGRLIRACLSVALGAQKRERNKHFRVTFSGMLLFHKQFTRWVGCVFKPLFYNA